MVGGSLEGEMRREQLHALLQRHGSVALPAMAETYGVSEMTIRRDLFDLERAGLARRVRGGAVAAGPEPFAKRRQREAAAKETIAKKMLPLVPTSGSIALDASSTIHRFALTLEGQGITVMTSGFETFQALQGKPGVRSCLTGGEIEEATGSLVGVLAQRAIRDFVFTRSFVSTTCLHLRYGATEATMDGAELKRAMRAASSSLVMAVDSTKLEDAASAKALTLSEIDILVTELDPADSRLDGYRDLVDVL